MVSTQFISNKEIKLDNIEMKSKVFYSENISVSYCSILQITDSLLVEDSEKKKSDIFYYILGIIILIAAAIIFRQRYAQYLEKKEQL